MEGFRVIGASIGGSIYVINKNVDFVGDKNQTRRRLHASTHP
jgi:hypothetical protein